MADMVADPALIDRTVDGVQLAGSVAARDMSLFGLFFHADFVGQSIMVLLLLASVWCWAIIIEKVTKMRSLKARAENFEGRFWSGGAGSLESLYEKIGRRPTDPLQATFVAGMYEWRLAADKGLLATGAMRTNLQQRVDRVMQVTITREIERIENGMTLLASVGSAAPFVGLFGTVWGIMRSFTSIAAAQNTTLAVVAPGIAEALLATAIGLFAAIPAVLAYNKFSAGIGRYAERLENFASEFSAILSRHLEEQRG